MRRVAVGVKERDGDRLNARTCQPLDLDAHFVQIERAEYRAVARDALVDFAPQRARNQRLGELEEQIVDVVALLLPHFEDVAEAFRGQQSNPGAAALDDRIGDERGAVHDVTDRSEVEPGACDQLHQPRQRAASGIVRGGQAFVQPNRSRLAIDQNEISEGAADFETDPIPRSSR
jgi:hypothetical protein